MIFIMIDSKLITKRNASVKVGLLLLLVLLAGCVLPSSTIAQSTKLEQDSASSNEKGKFEKWTPRAQMRVKRLSNPRVSPNGKRVAYEVSHADLEANRWVRQVYVCSMDRVGLRDHTTQLVANCWDAQWASNDSSLFVRALDENEKERVHLLDVDTGEMRPVSPESHQVGWFQPSPDSKWLAYTKFDDSRWKLLAVSLIDGRIKEWKATGSVSTFSWSPKGDRIVSEYLPTATLDWRQKSLMILDLEKDLPIPLETGEGAAWAPKFNRTGQRIAFVSSPKKTSWMRDFELRVLDLENGNCISLAPTPDRNVSLLSWHPHEDSLLGLEYVGSSRRLVSVPLNGSPSHYVDLGDRSIWNAHVSGNNIAFTSESWEQPPEVFVAQGPNFDVKQVSHGQSKSTAELGRTTTIKWTSVDGRQVEGHLTYPVGYQPGVRVPLLVRLHGGPPFPVADSFLGGTYMTAYPLAAMASEGFAILQPNFRGSAGYGRKFRHELHAEWGVKDYQDVMGGVDKLVAQGIVDPDRLGIMGWSYGGYLTAWTITQNDRFVAASMGAAMTDLITFDETTSLKGMVADWFGGTVDSRSDRYRKRSPNSFASKVACSVLIQHGRNDTTVPYEQATTFAELIGKAGIDFELLSYDGGHGPRTPRAELAVLEQNLDWFIRKLRDRNAKTTR